MLSDRKPRRRPLTGPRAVRRLRPSLDVLEDRRVLSASLYPVAVGYALGIGSTGNDIGQAIAADSQGDVYVTGFISGTVNFSPGAGTTSLTATGTTGAYVAKYNNAGNLVWANIINSTGGTDEGTAIAVSPSGDVYVTGAYTGTATAGAITLPAGPGNNAFVAHYSPTGNLISAVPIVSGGPNNASGSVFAQGIAADASGNVFLTGNFSGTVNFSPPGNPTDFVTATGGGGQAFFMELTSAGSLGWVRAIGAGSDVENGNALAIDSSDNVYGTGSFRNTVDFGSGFVLSSPGNDAAYVVKLNPSGNTIWARALAGSGSNQGFGVAVDASGDVYSGGYFQGTTNFNPGSGTADNLTSAGSLDAYVSKLDPSGNFLWAKQLGGAGVDATKFLALDSSGYVYATGFFQGTATLTPGGGSLTAVGSDDTFVLKLDSAGNTIWGTHYGGAGTENQANGIVVNPLGAVDVFGSFTGTGNFDPGPTTTNLTSQGGPDAYLATLVPTPTSVDNDDPGYSVTGGWTTVANRGGVNNDYQFAAPGNGTAAATWQIPVQAPGTYDVQVTWTPFPNRATNAPYEVFDGNTLLATVLVNQQLAPSGPSADNVTYQSLGSFPITSGTLRVVLDNNANSYVVADSARVAYPTPTPALVDNDGPNYAVTGSWTTVAGRGGNNQDYQFVAPSGSSTSTANATFTTSGLATGYYDVGVTWTPYNNRATNATYSIYDGTTLLATKTVDQTQNPVGLTSNGATFQSLGVFRTTTGTIRVVLGNNANNFVIADATRIVPAVSTPTNVDNDDPGYSVAGTWTTVANRGGVNNDYQFAAPAGTNSSPTATASWTSPVLAPGTYDVQATWTAFGNRADNAPYSIYDGSTLLATVRVNQQLAPAGGTTRGGVTYQDLGSFPINSGTLRVVLGNNADGFVVADSIYAAPFITAVADNDNASVFTNVGNWTTVAGRGGVNNDYLFAPAGNGSSTAVWQVALPSPGASFDVQATWTPYLNRATNATYQIFDGNTLVGTQTVDQTQTPAGANFAGTSYQDLGTYQITTGLLRVVLTNNANNFVIADAVRIDPVSTIP